jgi:MFS family permease
MILKNIYDSLDKDQRDGFVFGLVFGLASGFVFGLVFGLASGLVLGLVLGLAYGLVLGLASGLASDLVLGLAYGLVLGLASGLASGLVLGLVLGLASGLTGINLIWLIAAFFIVTEIIYWLDKDKPKNKDDVLKFTIIKKLESGLDSVLILGLVGLYRLAYNAIQQYFQQLIELLKTLGFYAVVLFGVAVVLFGVTGLVYIYLRINALKYQPKEKR